MEDQSYLDKRYFIDEDVYNCPFCNRRNVIYENIGSFKFDWSKEKKCWAYFVQCSSCRQISMHLSYEDIQNRKAISRGDDYKFSRGIDIDQYLFYSVPTSFFVVDRRIPRILRELITEAEGCQKMNYLTGASACVRKAIYELLTREKAEGEEYEDKIKSLKQKHPEIDPSFIDILAHIQDMTSEKLHEQSWPKWDSPHIKLLIETLKGVLNEIYVLPEIKKERALEVRRLQESIQVEKKEKSKREHSPEPTASQ